MRDNDDNAEEDDKKRRIKMSRISRRGKIGVGTEAAEAGRSRR